MFCSKCGAPLNGATFCASCGTPAIITSGVPVQPDPVQQSPTSYQMPPNQYGVPMVPKTNGLAVAGFVTSLACLGLPLGFILSLVALNQIKKSPIPQGGKGLAIAGAIIGSVWLVYILIVVIAAAVTASTSSYY